MSNPHKTDFQEVLADLNGGVYLEQINTAISDIAANVVSHGKKGELTLKLSISQIGDTNQVNVTHSLKSVLPLPRGRIIEENEVDTPLHVASGGKLSLFPNTQTRMEMGAGAATGRTDGDPSPTRHRTENRHG